MLSIFLTVLLTVMLCFLVNPILGILNTPEKIYERTYEYLFISFLGTGAAVFYNMTANQLRVLGDSRTPLYFLIFSSLLNVVLCIVVAGKKFDVLKIGRKTFRFRRNAVIQHLKMGCPMGFQMSIMSVGQLAMQAAVNGIGTSAIAGYTAATKMDQLSVLVDNAVGLAIGSYVAQNYGAKKYKRIKQGVTSCFLMLSILNVAMRAVMLLGRNLVVPLFVNNPTGEIIAYSNVISVRLFHFIFFWEHFWCIGLQYKAWEIHGRRLQHVLLNCVQECFVLFLYLHISGIGRFALPHYLPG